MKKLPIYLALIIATGIYATNAQAQLFASQSFYSYDGPVKPLKGDGGAKVVKNEIEYWVDGAPSRPFRIVGVMVDSRSDRWFSGSAVGSKAIAKKVKAAGGDAVIILDQAEKISSVVSNYFGSTSGSVTAFGNMATYSGSTYGSGTTEVVNNVKTRLYVIAYLNGLTEESATEAKQIEPAKSASFLPRPAQNATQEVAQFVRERANSGAGPAKRPAKSPSGYCYDVERGYVGAGTLNRPAITTYAPACWQLDSAS